MAHAGPAAARAGGGRRLRPGRQLADPVRAADPLRQHLRRHDAPLAAGAACRYRPAVVLFAPNTGLCYPHEQTAWTPPSPISWMVMRWSTADQAVPQARTRPADRNHHQPHPVDFGVGKRLTNLAALRQIGYTASRRLLAVPRLSQDPITGARVLHSACDPVIHHDGTRVAGLRLTDPRAQALLHILLVFRLHPGGFLNKDLRELLAEYLSRPPGTITPVQATYDLRRLREHGLIERVPHTHRCQVTPTGLRHAMFLTRILRTGLAALTGLTPAPLRKAASLYQAAIDDLTQRAGTAA